MPREPVFTGFLHGLRRGCPSLALDLVEEFRPIVVDGLVLALLRRGTIRSEDFTYDPGTGAVLLKDDPRAVFLREYELRILTLFTHEATGERVSYRRALLLQAQMLGRALLTPGVSYAPVLLK